MQLLFQSLLLIFRLLFQGHTTPRCREILARRRASGPFGVETLLIVSPDLLYQS
jgi:hypothetical protein